MTLVTVMCLAAAGLAAGLLRLPRRLPHVVFDARAQDMLAAAAKHRCIRVIAMEPVPYDDGPHTERDDHDCDGTFFIEVTVARTRLAVAAVHGVRYYGHQILAVRASSVGPAIAAVLLALRDATGHVPVAEIGWSRHSLAREAVQLLVRGHGLTAARTRHLLARAEQDPTRRPKVSLRS
ncbi:hypothetical protein [Catellatospora sichuanensis]|uniref:hypothetical protein n=1 Tax=Catellatospora sichuanensis TaxID=1969805 RepID=UPI001183C4E7|nr:hypothetical protein [Catellatospora sichuanensis]